MGKDMPEDELFNFFETVAQEERQENELKAELEEMLIELESSYFEVVLIPAPDPKHSGHCIRVLQSGNPAWYSSFCSMYKSCRGIGKKQMKRARTFIKRDNTIKALRKMLAGDFSGIYGERLLEFTKMRIDKRKREERLRAEYIRNPDEEFNPEMPF